MTNCNKLSCIGGDAQFLNLEKKWTSKKSDIGFLTVLKFFWLPFKIWNSEAATLK